MRSRGPLMFYRLAPYYDAFVQEKDYRGEVRRLTALARRYGRPDGTSWLDVACGTGRHLEFLRAGYEVAGVDLSPAMLRLARRRLPGVDLRHGDMRSFRFGRTFDVVSCLFSSVGHLRSERELRETFENFGRHLNPGGALIVEPWIDPAEFRPGVVFLMAHQGPNETVARMSFSTRRGNRSRLRIHYLVGRPRIGVRHFEETDVGLMVSRKRTLELLDQAGFRSQYIEQGLRAERGVFVGSRRPKDP